MAFIFIPCVKPTSKFLNCIPLDVSIIIMAVMLIIIAVFTFFENKVYFKGERLFGFLSKEIYMIIETVIATMIFIVYQAKKREYTTVIYLFTAAFTIFAFAINIQKATNFRVDEEIKDTKIRSFVEYIYFIRIGTEFVVDIFASYLLYSLRKQEELYSNKI